MSTCMCISISMCVFSSSHTLIHLPIYFHNLLGRIGAQSAHGDLPIHMHINRYEHHTQIRTRIYIYASGRHTCALCHAILACFPSTGVHGKGTRGLDKCRQHSSMTRRTPTTTTGFNMSSGCLMNESQSHII